jgi:transposase-like protein
MLHAGMEKTMQMSSIYLDTLNSYQVLKTIEVHTSTRPLGQFCIVNYVYISGW